LKEIAFSTGNAHKLEELRRIFAPKGLKILSPQDLGLDHFSPEETGSTFLANALIKSKALYQATGLPSLSDDSGLEVEALDGAPGIYSARYGQPGWTDRERAEFLLKNLQGVENRRARFICVIGYSGPEGDFGFSGTADGQIADQYYDSEYGFGYDPVFIDSGSGKAFSHLPPEEKNQISHRKKALDAFFQSSLFASLQSK
jgi:XTP/dITP diphosphohydrolase